MSFWVAVAIAFVAGNMVGFLVAVVCVAADSDAAIADRRELEALRAERAERGGWQDVADQGLLG